VEKHEGTIATHGLENLYPWAYFPRYKRERSGRRS
jgi:hypothetical protein